MFVDASGMHTVPTLKSAKYTVIHDRKNNMALMRINEVVVLPVGTEIELIEPNVNAVVTGIRLLAGRPATATSAGIDVAVCLDVSVPDEWWESKTRA
ncbi:hypothetical protein [Corallococcus sp. CA054B]|uniref:hypothetical protein n=1 Tax=Corallococcus sp. CA054B TaxID=2316734 RepID=UPI0011C42A98|nr:hypothetical protein [Corallococcus sp. CA054B]